MKFFLSFFLLISSLVPLSASKPTLHICTVASHDTTGFRWFLHSCNTQGIVPDVLGWKQQFRGLSWKLILMQKYLRTLPEDDIVLFADAFDVCFLNSSKEITKRFLDMGAPFAIAVEKYCWPESYKEGYPVLSPTSYNYLNIGTYIGYVGALKELLGSLPQPIPERSNDQAMVIEHYLKNQGLYTFDYHCQLFLPLFCVEDSEMVINRNQRSVYCIETGSYPCLIHGNGPGLGTYNKLFKQLYPKAVKPKSLKRYKFRIVKL